MIDLDLSIDGQKIVFDSQRSAINLLEVELDAAAETGRKNVSSNPTAAYSAFDVHPGRRRVVAEAFRFQESDISMIENIR